MREPMQPMLHTDDLDMTTRFFTDVLGFTVDGTWGPEPGGPATWCALSNGPARLMYTVGGDEPPAMTGRLYFYPDDVDRYHEQVVARGANTLGPPTDREYGMREFSLEDPNGYLMSFGQPLEH